MKNGFKNMLKSFCGAIYFFASAYLLSTLPLHSFSILPKDHAVRAYAVLLHENPPIIELHWNQAQNAQEYRISRRVLGSDSWQLQQTLDGNTEQWTDTSLQVSLAYEYEIAKRYAVGNKENISYSYVAASALAAPEERRGHLLLFVDSLNYFALTPELIQWKSILEQDGWQVEMELSPRAEQFSVGGVQTLKSRIERLCEQFRDVNAVILFGRVPIPYSGNFAPDDHNEHRGAWPADAVYGDVAPFSLLLRWTDFAVSNTEAYREENQNLRADGKFDNSYLPSAIEVPIGRIDAYNLPICGNEQDLLRLYIEKNIAFRMNSLPVARTANIADEFLGDLPEYFSAGAWSDFTAILGHSESISEAPLTSLKDSSVLLSYTAGFGTFQSVGSQWNSSRCDEPVLSVFSWSFGSYFGDWDSENNLLRAMLFTKPSVLASAWSGRPLWRLHGLGLNDHIGKSLLRTLNNDGLEYSAGRYVRGVHVGLMGDPTLRLYYLPSPLNAMRRGQTLEWQAPVHLPKQAKLLGYVVYGKYANGDGWLRLSDSVVAGHSFSLAEFPHMHTYMIKALYHFRNSAMSRYEYSIGSVAESTTMVADNRSAKQFGAALHGRTIVFSEEMPLPIKCELYSIIGEKIGEIDGRSQALPKQWDIPENISPSPYLFRILFANGNQTIFFALMR